MSYLLNDIDLTGQCTCNGCIGEGPCDLEPPSRCRGCGQTVGYDEDWCAACDTDDEEHVGCCCVDCTGDYYVDGDYGW